MVPLGTTMSVDNSDCRIANNSIDDECLEGSVWSSDCSNSEDEEIFVEHQGTSISQVIPACYLALVLLTNCLIL